VLHTIEAFFEVTRSYVSQDDSKLLSGIDTVYQSVIRSLLKISVEDEDHAEAGRLRQILAEPDPKVAKQLAKSLGDTAMRMRSTLDMLELPSEVQKVFKIGRATELYPPLHIALNYRIKFSAYELQQVPLESLRAKDPLLRNAVHVAAASSHTEFLRGVCLTPELLKDRDIFNNTPLMVAAYHGDYNSFRILWDTGVGHDLRDAYSRSIMFIACFVGSREIVEFLLLRGISQHDRGTFGNHHALYVVAARNHSEICKLLLEHDRTQGLFTPSETNEAVKVALENGHTKIFELLHGSTTHTTNPIQRLPDATQPCQSSEIEQKQTSFLPGYPSNPQTQCPPPPTITSAPVPTPGYSSDTIDTPNFLPGDWGGHTEWSDSLLQPCTWDPSTLESNQNFT
jgi:Ankyrin repeats (3 copies)